MKPPKPTALKRIEQGTLKVHRENGTPEELEVNFDNVKPFTQMTKTQKRIWHRLLKEIPNGIVSNADRDVFRILVVNIDKWCILQKDINLNGYIIEENGVKKKNPAEQMQRAAEETIYKYARLFGISPSARAGLEIAGVGNNKNEITFEQIREKYSR